MRLFLCYFWCRIFGFLLSAGVRSRRLGNWWNLIEAKIFRRCKSRGRLQDDVGHFSGAILPRYGKKSGISATQNHDCRPLDGMPPVRRALFASVKCAARRLSLVAHNRLRAHHHHDQHELRVMVHQLPRHERGGQESVGLFQRGKTTWWLSPHQIHPDSLQDVDIDCSAYLISQYRFLWLNLSELLQTLGNACNYLNFLFFRISFSKHFN